MEKRYPRTVMATACVPWDASWRFDESMFRKGVRLLLDNRIRSIYLFGTAGEGYAVNREQYMEIVVAFVDEMKKVPDSMPMVGVISLSMSEIIERIELGMKLGVRDFQISFPSWGAVSAEEGVTFIKDVCTRFPAARFMHYNNGFRSKTRLAIEEYIRLAEDVPNLVAVKNPGPGISELHDFHSVELPIRFYNLEFAYGYASMFSEPGLLISYCNLHHGKAWEYFDAGIRRDFEKIIAFHGEFQILQNAVLSAAGTGKMDGSYDKLFVRAKIEGFSQRLLPPYEGCGEEVFESFAAAVRERLPQWWP